MIKKNMIRYGRRNAVVPIMERIVEDDLISESDEERLIHFPFGFIHLVHNLSKDFQTFLCHGICSPAAGISDGEEWSSAPRAGYLGEEAVLNGVELGAIGRVVHDEDPHAKAVGKIHGSASIRCLCRRRSVTCRCLTMTRAIATP